MKIDGHTAAKWMILALLGIGAALMADVQIAKGQENAVIPLAEFGGRVACSEEYVKALEISAPQGVFIADVPEFVETPIIHSSAVCRIFLAKWLAALRVEAAAEVKLALQLKPSSDKPQRYSIVSEDFYQACRGFGLCLRDVSDFGGVRRELLKCQPRESLRSLFSRMMPRALRPRYEIIHRVDVRLFPFEPFTETLRAYIRGAPDQATFASTMTMGNGSARQLAKEFEGLSKQVFLALDAGLLFSMQETLLMAQYFAEHSSIHLIPITSGMQFKTFHHWKAIVNESSAESVLSSMNFSTPLKTPFVDLSYSFSDPEVTMELRSRLLEAFAAQCGAIEDYKCFADFSYEREIDRQNAYGLALSGCDAFNAYRTRYPESGRRYFMQPQDTDLEYLTRQLIDSAKRRVVLLSHKLTLPGVVRALERAAARGVQVYAVTSKRPPVFQAPGVFFFPSKENSSRRIPGPHMKVLVVDDAAMMFGTGNFSRNAFYDARELFAVTDDGEAIESVLRVAASLLQAYAPEKRLRLGLPSSPESWVAAQNTSDKDENDRARPLPGTHAAPEPWLRHYRKVDPSQQARLRECGLDHLLFIPERDYLDCIEAAAKEANENKEG